MQHSQMSGALENLEAEEMLKGENKDKCSGNSGAVKSRLEEWLPLLGRLHRMQVSM